MRFELTNYSDHPEEPTWIVFRFAQAHIAQEFIVELEREGVKHERDENGGPPFLVGVKQHHRERAVRINYSVLGRHRKPFMGDPVLRWSVFVLVALAVVLAVAGMVMSK
ncbi:MAG: hypothetical protein IPL52_01295 [Flavobacteriales bacterium]|nr:hypothetical protein [Flavobacteriales bacterium]